MVRADSGPRALDLLREAYRLAEEEVVLLLADHRMPGMTGVEFLEHSLELYPIAKRVLLTAYHRHRCRHPRHQYSWPGLLPAQAVEPAGGEACSPVMDELIEDWLADYKPPFEGVRVIGHRWSARSHEIKDLLARNHVPFFFSGWTSRRVRMPENSWPPHESPRLPTVYPLS